MIPTTSKWVDLKLLHPQFVTRLEAFFADGRITDKVKVVSACRSYAAQKKLYDKYKAGRGNLAANPDWLRPDGYFRGSFHQEQPDGYCYAVDLRIIARSISERTVTDIAARYGMQPTVKGEWWHFQPRNAAGWFDAIAAPALEHKAEPPVDWDRILMLVADIGYRINLCPLRRGARNGDVEIVQRKLNALGFDAGRPDGVFGRKTVRAVKGFQRATLLTVDGVVGHNTWKTMLSPEVPNGL
jgi:hypothetical protein